MYRWLEKDDFMGLGLLNFPYTKISRQKQIMN